MLGQLFQGAGGNKKESTRFAYLCKTNKGYFTVHNILTIQPSTIAKGVWGRERSGWTNLRVCGVDFRSFPPFLRPFIRSFHRPTHFPLSRKGDTSQICNLDRPRWVALAENQSQRRKTIVTCAAKAGCPLPFACMLLAFTRKHSAR